MTDNGTVARVATIPWCDLCRGEGRRMPADDLEPTMTEVQRAVYDAATRMGPWAYLCERHFQRYGVGLGTGRGQRLVKAD